MNKMTDVEINEALAVEGMGWHKEIVDISKYNEPPCIIECWVNSKGEWQFVILADEGTHWNPTSDLNQVWMIEDRDMIRRHKMMYLDLLDEVLAVEHGMPEMKTQLGYFHAVHATARQKCEALLMTFREVEG